MGFMLSIATLFWLAAPPAPTEGRSVMEEELRALTALSTDHDVQIHDFTHARSPYLFADRKLRIANLLVRVGRPANARDALWDSFFMKGFASATEPCSALRGVTEPELRQYAGEPDRTGFTPAVAWDYYVIDRHPSVPLDFTYRVFRVVLQEHKVIGVREEGDRSSLPNF